MTASTSRSPVGCDASVTIPPIRIEPSPDPWLKYREREGHRGACQPQACWSGRFEELSDRERGDRGGDAPAEAEDREVAAARLIGSQSGRLGQVARQQEQVTETPQDGGE